MGTPELRNGERFTYGNYLSWSEEERWELIDGVPYAMTPAPATLHQAISAALTAQLWLALQGKPCRAFAAPFDVRLPEGEEAEEQIRTVVQPDLTIVCNPARLDRRGCRGAPEFILEILSPSTAPRDQIEKVALYEKHGVREYWILHPSDRMLTVYRLQNGGFATPEIREARGRIAIRAVADLEVDFDGVFESVAGLE